MDALAVDLLLNHYLYLSRTRSKWLPEGQIKVVVPLTGVQSIVRVIEVDGTGRAVARIYPRRESGRVRHRARAADLVARHELSAPKILDVFDGDRSGAILVVEEFVKGEHPTPRTVDSDRVRILARVFARLHGQGVAADRFGPIGAPRRGRFSDEEWGRTRNRFRSVRRWSPSSVDLESQRRVKRWFRTFSLRLDELKSFSLIHDKPNRGNLIWNEESRTFFLVDLATLRYGHRAKDLAQVFHEVLGKDRDRIDLFLESYFSGGENGDPAGYANHEPFYHAYYHLGQCAINCRRRHKVGRYDDTDTDYEAIGSGNWRSLVKVVENNPV